jgi:hypothetical protein
LSASQCHSTMASELYINDTPTEVKNAKVRQRGDCNDNDS